MTLGSFPATVQVSPNGGAVRRHLHRRRKTAECHAAEQCVADGREFPEGAVRRAVRGGDEVVFAVGRDGDAVRTDEPRVGADSKLVIDPRAVGPEANDGELVVALGARRTRSTRGEGWRVEG